MQHWDTRLVKMRVDGHVIVMCFEVVSVSRPIASAYKLMASGNVLKLSLTSPSAIVARDGRQITVTVCDRMFALPVLEFLPFTTDELKKLPREYASVAKRLGRWVMPVGDEPMGEQDILGDHEDEELPYLPGEPRPVPRMQALPASPSAEDRIAHELTHCEFQTWCE